ncbi:hypothetical protein QTP81_02005 [Alteromonas sp. ASW11-36]|uniref:Uncharacterized protein n=1 Tax=Alteromonas arenosi TaxID=3055817 RepID=A0ABT7ST63_9ALTE|nr:hypothetical protein [Alteromonas sp. ASW11-36]MDM7859378.1 hypothetical protein [Alteromonas sp. ASW11-36]
MERLTVAKIGLVSGAGPISFISSAFGRSGEVLASAVNGAAPSPFPGGSFLTATASGPTPNNVGGRYPVSALGQSPSISNVGGGQLGRSVAAALVGDNNEEQVLAPSTDDE